MNSSWPDWTIGGVGIGGYDELAIVRVERSGVDALLIGPIAQGEIQVVLSIGKKLGPNLSSFALRQRPKRFRIAPGRGDTVQYAGSVCGEDDPVTIPRPAKNGIAVAADGDGRSSGEIHFLEGSLRR